MPLEKDFYFFLKIFMIEFLLFFGIYYAELFGFIQRASSYMQNYEYVVTLLACFSIFYGLLKSLNNIDIKERSIYISSFIFPYLVRIIYYLIGSVFLYLSMIVFLKFGYNQFNLENIVCIISYILLLDILNRLYSQCFEKEFVFFLLFTIPIILFINNVIGIFIILLLLLTAKILIEKKERID